MEQKYQKQVKDLQDNHNKLYSELLSRNKELEKDIKSLRLENEIAKNKNFNPSDLTKRLEQINKEKENLLKNENFLKEEQDKKVNELTVGFEKEKDNYKRRIAELEKNLREAEGKKGSLLLELEKEKAKWNIEKDNLVSKYSELNDKLTRVEKKNEGLLRENEKLRNEKNMLRRAGATTTGKYSLMLRDGNTLGSTILGNLGIGGKSNSNFGLSQNFKSSVLRGLDKGNQENSNNDNNNTISENFNMKEYSLGNIRINDENIQQNQDDNE
jgi:DNA repair exonuclease SbcCD ATPase subunit